MNDSIEEAMKAWRPRPASPGLRSRIFAPEADEAAFEARPLELATLMRWLVPALGCFVLVAGSFGEQEIKIPAGALAPLAGQQMAFSAAEGHSGWNNLPVT